jgi:hypothetical protein
MMQAIFTEVVTPPTRYRRYDKAAAVLEDIVRRGLQSVRAEHFEREAFAKRLGLPVQTLVNIERGHRHLKATEFVRARLRNGQEPGVARAGDLPTL